MVEVIELGLITQKEADEIAYSYSDKKGIYVLYPEFEGKENCYLVAEYNDDELEWGKIYTEEDLSKNLK